MAQTEYIGDGAITKLGTALSSFASKKIFLVTGKGSYATSGAQMQIQKSTAGLDVLHYTDFGALPLQEDIDKGIVAYKNFAPDLVITVGGGHVMDVAKAINHFAGKKPLIAIPTTAGSGSEATQFAVIYKDGLKTSLEGPDLLPTVAIVDPELSYSVPKEVALPSALDALAQSIESYWSTRSTDESREYSRQALELVWGNIVTALEERKPAAMSAVSIGAHLAGKAINISKTTACHAFSYGLTYRFGVPHGIAAAIFLPAVMRFNGVSLPGGVTPEAVEGLLRKFGITKLSQFGVTPKDIPALAAEVNVDRLGNNPRPVLQEEVAAFYTELL